MLYVSVNSNGHVGTDSFLDLSSIALSVCFLAQSSYMKNFVPAHSILVLIALLSNKGSGEAAQMHTLASRIHKIRMQIKTQTKFRWIRKHMLQTTNFATSFLIFEII